MGNRMRRILCVGVWTVILIVVSLRSASSDDLLNRCMLLIEAYSRETPGPEPTLECPQYRDGACCKPGATLDFQQTEVWMDITNYNRCPDHKSSLSKACDDRFFDELCFFLCSPDIGPWINKATHDEPVTDRIVKVPVCQSACDEWWSACKNEYTCTDNWYIGFNSTGEGPHRCNNDAVCDTYQAHFKTATNFCQNIWDNSFEVVADDRPCMQFHASLVNGNKDVAKQKADEMAAEERRGEEKEEL